MEFTDVIRDPLFIDNFSNSQVKTLGTNCAEDYLKLYELVNTPTEFGIHHQEIMMKYKTTVNNDTLIAAKLVIDNIRFGFQENFNEGIRHVVEPLGFVPSIVKTNAAPVNQPDFNISKQDMTQLRELNKYDIMLYEYAQEVYEERTRNEK